MVGNYYFHNGGGNNNNFEAGPSSSSSQNNLFGANYLGSQNYNGNNVDVMTHSSYWPELPTPFSCTCCQVLREIIHTNGFTFIKLEIHGRLGMICHAIHHQNINMASSSSNPQFQMIDMKTIQEIKNFLVQYYLEQISLGYVIMQDPLSAYYETLCIGLDFAEDLNDLNPYSDNDMEQEAENGRVPRPSLAEQRDRTTHMKLSDLSNYFHLLIEETGRRMSLCSSSVKKVSRKQGLIRWPHRKVKSIVKQITMLRKTLDSADEATRARTEVEISRLEAEMTWHCGGISPTELNLP